MLHLNCWQKDSVKLWCFLWSYINLALQLVLSFFFFFMLLLFFPFCYCIFGWHPAMFRANSSSALRNYSLWAQRSMRSVGDQTRVNHLQSYYSTYLNKGVLLGPLWFYYLLPFHHFTLHKLLGSEKIIFSQWSIDGLNGSFKFYLFNFVFCFWVMPSSPQGSLLTMLGGFYVVLGIDPGSTMW